jgi:hypothetical protein
MLNWLGRKESVAYMGKFAAFSPTFPHKQHIPFFPANSASTIVSLKMEAVRLSETSEPASTNRRRNLK